MLLSGDGDTDGVTVGVIVIVDVTVGVIVLVGAGWFITENILMKGEIVNQKYEDFPTSDIRSSGKFNGVVLQAIVGF